MSRIGTSTRGITLYDILGDHSVPKERWRLLSKLSYKYGYESQSIKLAPHPRAIKK
ncbi:hypothetical protein [Enterococcus gilvus]|uniref:hypothetical protein n=1 Tax=Enterococcus gilvus TaxID=160453 RepID=UPI001B800BC1|nr:hypothetical protein [Enterococcus gilvus]